MAEKEGARKRSMRANLSEAWRSASPKKRFNFGAVAFLAAGGLLYLVNLLSGEDAATPGVAQLPRLGELDTGGVAAEVRGSNVGPGSAEVMRASEDEVNEGELAAAKADQRSYIDPTPMTAEDLPPLGEPVGLADMSLELPLTEGLAPPVREQEGGGVGASAPRTGVRPPTDAERARERMGMAASQEGLMSQRRWVETIVGTARLGAVRTEVGVDAAPPRMRVAVTPVEVADAEGGSGAVGPAGGPRAPRAPALGRVAGAGGGMAGVGRPVTLGGMAGEFLDASPQGQVVNQVLNPGLAPGAGARATGAQGGGGSGAGFVDGAGRAVAHRVHLGDVLYGLLRVDADSDQLGRVLVTVVSEGPLKGSRMVGQMGLDGTGRRITVDFGSLYVNDELYPVEAAAIDPETGAAGLRSRLNRRLLSRWGALLGSAFAQGYAESLVSTTVFRNSVGGVNEARESIDDAEKRMLYAGGRAVAETVPAARRHFDRPATVEVDAEDGVGILFWSPVDIFEPGS